MSAPNLSDLRIRVENLSKKPTHGNIIYIRLKITDLIESFSLVESILPQIQRLFDVRILRDPHSVSSGIFIVGRSSNITYAQLSIISIIRFIKTSIAEYTPKRTNIHLTTVLFTYKHQLAARCTMMLKRIKKESPNFADLILIKELINNTPYLKTKKRYYGSV